MNDEERVWSFDFLNETLWLPVSGSKLKTHYSQLAGGPLSRLLLVRHGETEANSSLRYWGRTDVALSLAGRTQAECGRDRLSGEKIDFIFSSPLRRALVTSQIIAGRHNIEVTACPELMEIDYGQLEGLTFDEINIQYPDIATAWIQQSAELAYPGGESLAQLDERSAKFKKRTEALSEEKTVLIVAHAGILRSLICRLLGLESKHRWQIRLDLASVSEIDIYGDRAILALLNDTSHLKQIKN